MEGHTRTRDGSQQPQQGTVGRETLILYCLELKKGRHVSCYVLETHPDPQTCPGEHRDPAGPCPSEKGGCKVQPARPSQLPSRFPTLALLSGYKTTLAGSAGPGQ